MVTKRISSNEAKQNWGSILSAASSDPESAVIVESHGKPKAAVISIELFQELRDLQRKAKRAKALDALRQIEAKYDGRNDHLTDDQINDIAVEIGREVNRAAAERHRERVAQTKQSS